jgi:hypothetical protein
MSSYEADGASDGAILDEISALTGRLSDERARAALGSTIDAVALNPQPLPPAPPPEAERSRAILVAVRDMLMLNPQPIPPG